MTWTLAQVVLVTKDLFHRGDLPYDHATYAAAHSNTIRYHIHIQFELPSPHCQMVSMQEW